MAEPFDIEDDGDEVVFRLAPPPPEPLVVYALALYGPQKDWSVSGSMLTSEVSGIRPGLLREAEENLTDMLPKGYSVKIYKKEA